MDQTEFRKQNTSLHIFQLEQFRFRIGYVVLKIKRQVSGQNSLFNFRKVCNHVFCQLMVSPFFELEYAFRTKGGGHRSRGPKTHHGAIVDPRFWHIALARPPWALIMRLGVGYVVQVLHARWNS